MKVLVIPAWYNSDTRPLAGNFFGEQTKALISNRVDASIIYADFKSLARYKDIKLKDFFFLKKYKVDEGIPTFRINGLNLVNIKYTAGKKLWSYFTMRLYNEYVGKFGVPDIIQAHAYMSGYAASHIKKKYGIPYVLTEHSSTFLNNSIPENQYFIVKEAFDNADVLTSVSKPLAQKMQAFTEKEIVITPNFINTDFFEPNDEIAKNEKFTYLFVAGLREIKNIPLLIRSFKRIADKVPTAQLFIGGDGGILESLKQLADSLNLGDQVKFLGKLTREEVVKELCKAHVFVVSSWFETFGVVVIEALSMGLPVVATKCGGPEYILTDELGILVENNDEEGYANALLSVYENYGKYDPVFIRNHAVSNYSDDVISTNIIEIYNKVIEKNTYAEKTAAI